MRTLKYHHFVVLFWRMSMMNMELYDALISIGANEDRARKAAETVIEKDQVATKHDIELLRGEINSLKWITGSIGIAILVGVVLNLIIV